MTCLQERAVSVDPGSRRVETEAGGSYAFTNKVLVASGGAAPVPPEGFVDEGATGFVRVLGLGEASDAAIVEEASRVAARGGEVQGRKRVIQRLFNVGVLEAMSERKASTL